LCYCGNRGCLEAFAGGRAIAARAEAFARDGRSATLAAMLAEKKKLALRDVVKAVGESDPDAVGLIRESGNAIGTVLAGLANFFNPSHIIVGGGVSQVGDVFLAAIRQAIYQHSLPLTNRSVVISHSILGANAGLVGAAR
jgi:predicted NBD/HSP70 family sugar kinase